MEFSATAFFSRRVLAVLTDSAISLIIHVPAESANFLAPNCQSGRETLYSETTSVVAVASAIVKLLPAMCYDFPCISLHRPRRHYSGGIPLHVTYYLDGACHCVRT